jgi:hypothetical protein
MMKFSSSKGNVAEAVILILTSVVFSVDADSAF